MRKKLYDNDKYYINQMLFYIDKIDIVLSDAKSLNLSLNDELVALSLSMCLGQIGEQLDSNKLSKAIKEKYDYIDWAKIKGFRNKAYHNYGELDIYIVSEIIKTQIPKLKESLLEILNDLEREERNKEYTR